MKRQIRLGRLFGIEIGLHLSWFIIAFLIVMSLGQRFASNHRDWSSQEVWTTAILTALLFFFTLVLHELAHSIVAKAHGIPVKAITLFALGGVSQIERESEDPRTEFWIGIAGPLASLFIGGACLAASYGLGRQITDALDSPVLALLVWLGYINFGLAAFNLVPGFPLDGGRVLRALLWWRTKDGLRATRLAAQTGHWIAMALILLGIVEFFTGSGLGGLWLAFIGLFLNEAAQANSLKAEWHLALKNLSVKDVMTPDCPMVTGSTDLDTFVHDFLLRTGQRCYLVRDDGANIGLVTFDEVKRVEKSRWPATEVRQIARGINQLPRLQEQASAEAALQSMEQDRLEEEAVTSDGRLVGIVSRAHILQILHARMALHV